MNPLEESTKEEEEFLVRLKTIFMIENKKLVIYLLSLIFFASADIVLFAIFTQAMKNYPDESHQLIIFTYIPVFFSAILVKLLFTKDITKEMVEYPKKKFLAMALCDVGATGLAVFGSTRTPGPYQTLLRQGSLISIMIFSMILLHYRYRFTHYLGVIFVIGGIVISVMFDLGSESVNFLFCTLFFLQAVPIALGSIYKEAALKDVVSVEFSDV